jgi:hypothetical protein
MPLPSTTHSSSHFSTCLVYRPLKPITTHTIPHIYPRFRQFTALYFVCMNFENGSDWLSQNVGEKPSIYVAHQQKRAKASTFILT